MQFKYFYHNKRGVLSEAVVEAKDSQVADAKLKARTDYDGAGFGRLVLTKR